MEKPWIQKQFMLNINKLKTTSVLITYDSILLLLITYNQSILEKFANIQSINWMPNSHHACFPEFCESKYVFRRNFIKPPNLHSFLFNWYAVEILDYHI